MILKMRQEDDNFCGVLLLSHSKSSKTKFGNKVTAISEPVFTATDRGIELTGWVLSNGAAESRQGSEDQSSSSFTTDASYHGFLYGLMLGLAWRWTLKKAFWVMMKYSG